MSLQPNMQRNAVEPNCVTPIGDSGPTTDRDQQGRFAPGNRAALVVGDRSTAFWAAQADARRAIIAQVIADAGYAVEDAPCALRLSAEGIAQAALVRDAAFLRVIESGGPMTASGRTRRAFVVWLAAIDRLERHLRLVGLRRVPRDGGRNVAEAFAAMHEGGESCD